jgi:lysophospholipase L1-like esterase
VDIPLTGSAAFAARIALLLVISQISYKYLEMPIRRGALGQWWVRLKAGDLKPLGRTALAGLLLLVLFAGFVGYRVATTPAPPAPTAGQRSQDAAGALPVDARLMVVPPVRDAVDLIGVATPGELNWARRLAAGSPAAATRADKLSLAAKAAYGIEASAFGDSVLLGAAPALEREAFNLDLYARVAQQTATTAQLLAAQAASGALRPVVIIDTGNNGIIAEADLKAMLTAAKGADRVVLVNTKLPRSWSKPNNRVIAQVAKQFENVRLVDLAKLASGHPEYFVKDGVHLTWAGAQAYSDAIEAAAKAD